jgi:hypothetical protein
MGRHNHVNTHQREELLFLASDVAGCRGYEGAFNEPIEEGGDCSHVDISHTRSMDMKPFVAYAGNVMMLHESLPMTHTCQRTVVRLNVPLST